MTSMPSYLNRLSIVKQIPIFQQLNFFELNRVARKATLVDYKKGDIICKQGAPADAFYCLVSGRVYSYTLNSFGQKGNAEPIHRGMHFGILSALTGENHSHNFEAINDSVILKIDRDDFGDILKATPRLGVAVSQSLSRRIRSDAVSKKGAAESMIISVYSPVKGSGSSTYSINLALSLGKETGKKVLLIGLESTQNNHAAAGPDVANNAAPQWRSTGVLLQNIVDEPEKILQSIIRGELEIDFLNATFDSGDRTLVNKISRFVSAPVDEYNYIVVDLPNEMDDMVLKTLTQSDLVHLVVADREKDLAMTRQVIDRLNENLSVNFSPDKVSVILSGAGGQEMRPRDEIKKILDYDIYAVLPHLEHAQLKIAIVSKELTVITPDPTTEYARTVVRIARKVSGVLVGLVLGGGAALGMAHIGVIRVLERENIPVDIVIGSSMGALIASIWAVGKNADELEFIAREFKKKAGLLKLFDPPVFPISGLIRGHKIGSWLRGKLGNKTFSDTRIPFRAIAYDLLLREELVIDRGGLVEAVQKSIAIPGVIKPVLENGQMIIDGGVLNPLPTNVLINMGIKKIIAVNVLQSPSHVAQGHQMELKQLELESKINFAQDPVRFVLFRLGRVFAKLIIPNISDIIVRTLQASEYIIAEQSCRNANVVIHPNLVGINWFELYKVDELIRLGEEATIQQLPAIRELIKE